MKETKSSKSKCKQCKRCGKCCSDVGIPIYFEKRGGDGPAMKRLQEQGIKFAELQGIPAVLFGKAFVPITSEEQIEGLRQGELKDKKCPFLDASKIIAECTKYEERSETCKSYRPGGTLCK